MCLANEHMLEEAVTTFTEVITRDPQHADAFYNLGVAYAYLEKKDEALEMLGKAIDVQPDHMLALHAQKLIQEAE
jgi:tetratricopeptide (TPR) repeat protein